MAVGFAPAEDEEDVAGPLPGAAPAQPPADPTVMTPLGQLPPSAIPTDQPPAAAPPDQGAPPTTREVPQPADVAPPPAVAPIPPRPVRPPLTGDPAKDVQSSLEYERALEDWHAQRLDAATQAQAQVNADRSSKEAVLRQEEERRRAEEQKANEAALAQQRQAISDATQARARAMGDLESGKWKEQSTGAKIASDIALALGTIGAGFSAAGGHPTGNLAAQVIDNRMDREYKHAVDRVNNANESIQQARYGYKDAQDNHRAALNDIDADMAAKYKLVAEEAASQMQARGASPEQIHNSELVTNALQKAAQFEDQIHLREIEAQRKAEALAQKKALDESAINRNNAQADSAEALAGFRARRTAGIGKGGGAGGKAAQKAQKDELKDIEHVADKEGAVLLGSARSQGAKIAYESAQAVANELRRAAASGDPDAMKIAVMHAQEQSTRFLTGAAPTQQTFDIQHGLAGTPEQLEARIAGWIGQPTEAKSYVERMAKNIDAIARQRKEVLTQEGGALRTRLESIVKSDEGRRRAQGILDQYLGKGALQLGGGGSEEAAPKRTQKIGGATYEYGDDGNWHKVK